MSDSIRLSKAMAMPDRIDRWFRRSMQPVANSDCWAWCGSRDRNGYGSVGINGRLVPVHRVFYEYFIADIPPGLEIDHLCRKRNCVNPWHMEPVTRKVNMGRAIGVGRYDRSKSGLGHCGKCSKFFKRDDRPTESVEYEECPSCRNGGSWHESRGVSSPENTHRFDA